VLEGWCIFEVSVPLIPSSEKSDGIFCLWIIDADEKRLWKNGIHGSCFVPEIILSFLEVYMRSAEVKSDNGGLVFQ